MTLWRTSTLSRSGAAAGRGLRVRQRRRGDPLSRGAKRRGPRGPRGRGKRSKPIAGGEKRWGSNEKWMEYHWATCMYILYIYIYIHIYIYNIYIYIIYIYIYKYYKLFCLGDDWYNGNMLWNIDPPSTVWVCLKVADACYSQKAKSCLFKRNDYI